MPSTGIVDGSTASGQDRSRAERQQRFSGEKQMAVTAIDHGRRVVTVTSRQMEIVSSKIEPPDITFATSIYGGPLNDLSWHATSWSASLRNHAIAVNRVIEAIALDLDRND